MGGGASGSKQKSWSEGGASSSSVSGLTPEQILKAYDKVLPKISTSLAKTQKSLLQEGGPGREAAISGSDLMRELNPEYYSALQSAAGASQTGIDASKNLLSSIDLTGLSPGEYAAAERALNQSDTRSGNAGLINPTNTIKNALNFGGAFNTKLGLLQNAIQANTSATGAATGVAGAASPSVSGFDPLAMALGGGDTFANNFLDAIVQRSTSSSSAWNQSKGTGSSSSAQGSLGCCFIFMEAYKGPLIPEVRIFRDRYYRLMPSIADGYKKMAKWLVPLMRNSNIVRSLVWNLMIGPATNYCKNPKYGINKKISHMWLRVWAIYGKI